MACQPGLYLSVPVGGVVVDDRMDQLARRHLAFDGIEEADELLVPVSLHAATDHRTFQHVQCGEQRRRSMAFVVVGHGAAAAGFQRQSRLGTVERLDLALFVDRQHHRVGGRIEIKADDIRHFLSELRSTRALEAAHAVRLELVRRPDALHRAQIMAVAFAMARPVQYVVPGGGSPHVSATTCATLSAGIGRLPGLRVLSRSNPSGPSSAKRCCQRQTMGRLTLISFATCCTGRPLAEARTTRARSMYLPARLRSDAIALSRFLSAALNNTHTVCAMLTKSHGNRML